MFSQKLHITSQEDQQKSKLTSVERFALGAEIQLEVHGSSDPTLLQKIVGVYKTVTRRPRTYVGEEIGEAPPGWYWTTFEGIGRKIPHGVDGFSKTFYKTHKESKEAWFYGPLPLTVGYYD